MIGEEIHDITTEEDERRARAAPPAVTVSPDAAKDVERAIGELISPSALYAFGVRRPPTDPPVMHVDPRLPSRSWHQGPPRP